jgi:WD40 repeat protein
MEKSRREAAQAQIVIAEAANQQGKADQMHLALSKVPEDLRGQTWSYLNDATTLGHVGIAPDGDSSWAGLEADPSQSGNFLAMQSNGTCVNVDSITGASTVRWKANDIKPRYGEFAVASDGSAVAIGIGSEIQIRRVEDGVIVQRIKLQAGTGVYSRLWLFKDQLFVQVSENLKQNLKHFLSAWSVADGRLLWRRPQRIWPAFCAVDDSPGTICLLTGEGKLEKINAITGDIVEQGKAVIGQIGWRKEAIAGNSGWKTFALSNDERRVRVYSNPWSDTLRTEFLPDHNVASLALVPNSELLLVLCMPSDQAGCLEVRDCSQGGKLLRSFPFQNPKLRSDYSNALRCTDSHAALLLPNKIRIWNLLTADKPSFTVTQPQGKKFHMIKMSPNGREVFGLRIGDDQKLKEVCLYNISETGVISKEISQTAIADGKISISATSGISVQMSESGSVAIVQDRMNAIALNLGDGKIINAWGLPKTLQANDKQDRLILPHPSLGLLWTGEAVVDISSGAQLTQVNRTLFKNVNRSIAPTPCWIGSDRLVEHCSVDGVRDSQDPEAYLERVMVLWNTSTGEAVSYESSPLGVCLSVSSDGNQIAEGCKDRRVRFRNAKNLAIEGEFLVHDSVVRGVDWHPNGRILATMGDSEIRLWDVRTGRLLEEIRIKGLAKSLRFLFEPLRFLAGGRRLIAGDSVFEPKCCGQDLKER